MASPQLSAFVYKSCVDAIAKYKAGEEDPDKLLRMGEWLVSFREGGAITDAQLASLEDMLGIDVPVPDAPDTWEDSIAAVQQDVSDQGSALAELSGVVSDQGEAQEVTDAALAELSEIVSGLVPTE